MSKNILIEEIIGSKAADDDNKGNKVFEEIKRASEEYGEEILLDFDHIELVNTAFLNNAIGQLFNKNVFDITKNKVRIVHMQEAMVDLVRESISVAYEKYS